MLYYPTPQDSRTWREASDEAWAERAVAAYRLAVGEQGDRDALER
jgi:hypothetical protein